MEAIGKLLDHLGYATPLLYAAAAYGLFAWLEESASAEARITLASMLTLRPVDTKAIVSAVTGAFDRVYTSPLLSWTAFLRSMLATIVVTACFLFERRDVLGKLDHSFFIDDMMLLTAGIAANVLLDYIALFVVRGWLPLLDVRLVEPLVVGPLLASGGVLLLGIAMRMAAVAAFIDYKGHAGFDPLSFWFMIYELTIPAIAVFAWLPLFALGIIAIRARNAISRAVGFTQWFLKEGNEHPLKAIGVVAAVAVFVVAAGWETFAAFHVAAPLVD